MSWHILFFNGVVVAGATIGLGGIAAALYLEYARGRRKREAGKNLRLERRRTEAA